MPTLDSTAKAAVAGQAFARASFIFLDISGDPLRVTNFGQDVTFAGTGDSDLDGNTFISFGGQFLDVSDVSQSESGSDALTVTLSGIVTLDTTLLNDIGNVALWQGRLIRTWFRIYDESGVTPQGAIVPEYTGYMSGVKVGAAPEAQTIQLSCENWLAAFNDASNRTYLGQKDYDAADNSAAATLAAANAARHAGGAASSGSGASSGGWGGAGKSGAFGRGGVGGGLVMY
jgi:hypothetical protein